MKERIARIIQREGLTAAQFAEKIGASTSSLSHILNGRNNPSLDIVMKIHKTCDYINLNWLLYGEGEMETDVDSDNNLHSAAAAPSVPPSSPRENWLFPSEESAAPENRKEIEEKAPLPPVREIVREEIKYIEKPARKITEIRIFYDNGTYDTFKAEK